MDNELYHHGIVGMKWGIRRYQNKDGSLTPRGQKRYNKEMDKLKEEERVLKNREATKKKLDKLEAKRQSNEARKKALNEDDESKKTGDINAKSGKKSLKDMSDAELAAAIERGRLESQYKQFNPDPPVKQSFAKKFVNEAAVPALVNAGRNAIQNLIQNKVSEMMKGKVDPNSLEGMKAVKDKLQVEYDIKSLKDKLNGKKGADDINYDNELKRLQYEEKIAAKEAKNNSSNNSNTNDSNKNSNNPVNKTNVNSGKKAVDNAKNVKTSKLPQDKDWQSFVDKYSWGRESYAMDEVVD